MRPQDQHRCQCRSLIFSSIHVMVRATLAMICRILGSRAIRGNGLSCLEAVAIGVAKQNIRGICINYLISGILIFFSGRFRI